ncbi:GntR family transcriptional regulator [Pseudomonas putida]|nr:GntR family transcriptional regulator [Pseudomonas putida]
MEKTITAAQPAPLTADGIAEALREAILQGHIGIGVQLKQEALARQFGVSRIPVREALGKLEAQGLVRHVARQGSVVASKSIDELVEILDIRIALETRALRLSLPSLSEADFMAAHAVLQRYEASDIPRDWAELNLEFHSILYGACNRPTLLRMIADTVKGIDIHLRVLQSYSVGRKSSMADHAHILEACQAGDTQLAISLLEAHIAHTQTALLDGALLPGFPSL